MTTEEGPVESRFEYCDTQKVNIFRFHWIIKYCVHLNIILEVINIIHIIHNQIINEYPHQRCKTTYPINAIGQLFDSMYDEPTCTRYWQEAVTIDNRIHTAHRIKVNDAYCYNPNILDPNKGWCHIANDPLKWGVCSPMCHQTFMQVCLIRIHLTTHKFKYLTLFKCIVCKVQRTWVKFPLFYTSGSYCRRQYCARLLWN